MAVALGSKRPQLTHFLCIPLVTAKSRPQLSQSLASFQRDVTRDEQLGGFSLPVEAVRPVGTLHLTLGVMSFPRDEGLAGATALLASLDLAHILRDTLLSAAQTTPTPTPTPTPPPPPPLLATLQGLQTFQQRGSRATVLYTAPRDPSRLLHAFCDRIRASFADARLLVPEQRPLTLHATIVRTTTHHGPRTRGIKHARAIMDRYQDRVWADKVPIDRVAICRMGARVIEKDGLVVDSAYDSIAEVRF